MSLRLPSGGGGSTYPQDSLSFFKLGLEVTVALGILHCHVRSTRKDETEHVFGRFITAYDWGM